MDRYVSFEFQLNANYVANSIILDFMIKSFLHIPKFDQTWLSLAGTWAGF